MTLLERGTGKRLLVILASTTIRDGDRDRVPTTCPQESISWRGRGPTKTRVESQAKAKKGKCEKGKKKKNKHLVFVSEKDQS